MRRGVRGGRHAGRSRGRVRGCVSFFQASLINRATFSCSRFGSLRRHFGTPLDLMMSVSCFEKATSSLTACLFRDASPHRGAVVRWSRSRASCRTASFEVRAVHRLRPAAGGLGDRRPPTKPAPDLSPFSSSGPNVHMPAGASTGGTREEPPGTPRGSVAAPFRTRSDWRCPPRIPGFPKAAVGLARRGPTRHTPWKGHLLVRRAR